LSIFFTVYEFNALLTQLNPASASFLHLPCRSYLNEENLCLQWRRFREFRNSAHWYRE